VRLAAIKALLQIDGPAHLPLLGTYLEAPLPPLRITAHQMLAQIDPSDIRLSGPVADVSAPLALRLAALGHLITDLRTIGLLTAILSYPDEPPQLRMCVAGALGHSGQAEAARALHAALRAGGPPLLRRRYIAALSELATAPGEAGETAKAISATLAQSSDAPAEERHWAAEQLLDRALSRDIQ
jgi:HEAT repeat protein